MRRRRGGIGGEGEVAQAGAALAAHPIAGEAAAHRKSAGVGLAAGDGKAVQHGGPGDGRGCAIGADDVIGVGAVDVGGVRHHAVGIRVIVAADVAAEHRDVGRRVALGARSSPPAKPP